MKIVKLNELVKQAHDAAVAKGFYPAGEKRCIGEMLMLIVSELGEALEADRKGRHASCDEDSSNPRYWLEGIDKFGLDLGRAAMFENGIKDTFEDELADAVIRIADLAGYLGIDLEAHVKAKMAYNATRPIRHGKAY